MSNRNGIFRQEIIFNMIGKLLSSRLLLLTVLVSVFSIGNISAQTTVLASGYTNPGFSLYADASDKTQFISFDIQNDNQCPVQLTRVGMFHPGLIPFTDGTNNWNVSNNDSTYELYYSSSNTSGNPTPINQTNGWTLAKTSNPINTGSANLIVDTMFTGLNIVIPANSKMRFIIYTNDTLIWGVNNTPLSTTANNLTLIHGSSNDVWTGYGKTTGRNAGNFTNANIINFVGNVALEQLPPTKPSVTVNPAAVCAGDSVTIRATHPGTGETYTLRHPNGNIIETNNTTGIFGINNPDAGNYTVTVNLCGKESDREIARVVVNNPPAPTVDGKFNYCLNEPYIPVTVNGNNPRWYYTPTGGSPIPVTPTINTSFPNVLFYYVSQTDQFGCESQQRTQVRLSAAPKPDAPVVTTPQYYCENTPADQLTAAGDTLKWYYDEQGGIPTSIAPTPNTSKRDSFDYYVTQTIDGCESDRSKIDVVVTFRPNGLIVIEKQLLCAEDSIIVEYFGSAFPTAAYNWTLPDGSVVLNPDTAFDQGPLRLQLLNPGRNVVHLQVGNSNCLSDVYTEDVYVKPLPTGKILSKDNVCLQQPELISMKYYTKTTDTFTWDFDGGLTNHFTTDQGPYGVYWNTPGKKIISVTLQDSGCVEVITDSLIVRPKPDAGIIAEYYNHNPLDEQYIRYNVGDTLCASDSLRLTARTIEPTSQYTWSPSAFFDTYDNLAVTYARVDTRSNITLEVVDEFGCINTDTLSVITKSCCDMAFPNAFSPNGDGINDYFQPVTTGNREIKSFQIFNRYGQVVYDNKGFRNGWDGTINGTQQGIGTYFFLISFDCEGELVHQKGEFILIR